MSSVVIKLHSWTWHSPAFLRRLQEHTKDLDPEMLQDRPEAREKDGAITNQSELDKWDNGWRQFEHSAKVEIPLEVLSYYLPCEVEAIHHGTSLYQVQQRTDAPLNIRAQVITPGHALQDYDETCVEVDCCTDHLQTMLNQGWRILAICVQPDQRRPDYVLGRRVPEGGSLPVPHPDRARPKIPSPTIAPDPPRSAGSSPDDDYPF